MSLASTCFTYIVYEIDFRLMKTGQKCHVAVFFVFSNFCDCFYTVHHEFQVQYIKRRPWLFSLYRFSVTATSLLFSSISLWWHLSRTHAYTIKLDTKFLVDKSHVRWLALSTWWILRDRVERSLFTFSVTWSTPRCRRQRHHLLHTDLVSFSKHKGVRSKRLPGWTGEWTEKVGGVYQSEVEGAR